MYVRIRHIIAFTTAVYLGFAAGSLSGQTTLHSAALSSDSSVRAAYQHFYDLDYPACIAELEKVRASHPGDPTATTFLLEANVFEELYRQDLLDTTFYANDGFLTGKHPTPEDTAVRDRIFMLEEAVEHESEALLSKNPHDVDAFYARGWARSLRAAYMAMVERSFSPAFHMALAAHSDEAKVLQIDPNYADAKLVVGTYQYVIGALPWGFKLLFGFAGITGSKTRGMEMLHDDFAHGPMTSIEAGTVIALFLRRDGKYQEAIAIVRKLEASYPHDFLFAVEEANLRKDAGEGMAAVQAYENLLIQAQKPDFFPSAHLQLAYFGLGDALIGQHHFADAAKAYEQAAFTPGSGAELKRRCLVSAGKSHDLNGERALAIQDYKWVIANEPKGADTTQGDIARRYLKTPYQG